MMKMMTMMLMKEISHNMMKQG